MNTVASSKSVAKTVHDMDWAVSALAQIYSRRCCDGSLGSDQRGDQVPKQRRGRGRRYECVPVAERKLEVQWDAFPSQNFLTWSISQLGNVAILSVYWHLQHKQCIVTPIKISTAAEMYVFVPRALSSLGLWRYWVCVRIVRCH